MTTFAPSHWVRAAAFATLLLFLLAPPAGTAFASSLATATLFAPPTLIEVGMAQRHIAIADFNRDGVSDLVISAPSAVEVRLGTINAGEPTYPAGYRLPITNANEATVADFNSDGILDIALAGELAGLWILRGNGAAGVGDGTFTHVASYDLGSAWSVLAADVNADGILDLVLSLHTGLRIFVGTGAAGQGDGGFLPPRSLATAGYPKGIAVTDVDQDGMLDIVVATERAFVSLHRGRLFPSGQPGDFAPAEQFATAAGGLTYDVCVADFDGNGKPDIASGDYLGGSVSVYTQMLDGSFAPYVRHALPGATLGLRAADFNHDGHMDLVAGMTNSSGTFGVLLNQGPQGTSPDHLGFVELVGPARVTFGLEVKDINGDGAVEVFAAGLGDTRLALFHDVAVPGQHPLFVTVVGSGQVVREPYGVTYVPGTEVTLTAVPAPGYRFLGWSGDVTGTDLTISVVMGGSRSVIATFELVLYTLAVNVTGPGSVTRSPNAAVHPMGSTVRLTAFADLGHVFAGWSGDASGSNPEFDLVMDSNKIVGASFIVDEFLTPVIQAVADVPQDEGGQVELSWTPATYESQPPNPTNRVVEYRLWREVPQAAGLARLAEGGTEAADSPNAILRTTTADREYFWEYVATVPTSAPPIYRHVVATTNDSTEFGNPYTSFLVQAKNASKTLSLESPPDSGYSVDNLAPPSPAQVFVSRQAGRNVVRWTRSAAADLEEYRLHRGTSAEFVPSASSLVATTRDTTLLDTAPEPAFYKVVAVDRHGNRSAHSLASGFDPAGEPRFAILGVVPNPSPSGRLTVRLVLPSAVPATLELLDLQGRLESVRQLPSSPGEHAVPFGMDQRVRPGVYWIRLRQGSLERSMRAVVID